MGNNRSRLIVSAVFLVITAGLIALVVFGDLGGVDDEAAEAAVTETPEPLFPGAAGEPVVAFRVEDNETGQAFAASTEDGETWAIDEAPEGTDTALGADQTRILAAIAGLPTMQPIRVLSGVEAMASYGLESAPITLTFRLTNGDEHTITIGEKSPTGSGYYVSTTPNSSAATDVLLIPAATLDQVVAFLTLPPVLVPTPEADFTATVEP